MTTSPISSPFRVDAATAANNRNLLEAQSKSKSGTNSIDMTGYLELLTAQIKYQDPFEPMDNTQMVSQMTQFSQLAGQTEANAKLDAIASALTGSRLSDASGWIGRSMLVESKLATPDVAGGYSGQITLANASSNVAIDLVDADGKVVKSIELGAKEAGDVPFYWSGLDAEGNRAASGPLAIQVRGGAPRTIASWATIAAVQSPASGSDAKLITPLGTYTPADALSLS